MIEKPKQDERLHQMVRVGTTGFLTVVEKRRATCSSSHPKHTRWIASIYGDRTQKGGTE
jgi:hypothetical protein